MAILLGCLPNFASQRLKNYGLFVTDYCQARIIIMTKTEQIKQNLEMVAKWAAQDWRNGNLTDAVERICVLPTMAAAFVAVKTAELLKEDDGMFLRRLLSEAATAQQALEA
jgi:hypothetical protein